MLMVHPFFRLAVRFLDRARDGLAEAGRHLGAGGCGEGRGGLIDGRLIGGSRRRDLFYESHVGVRAGEEHVRAGCTGCAYLT